MVDHERIRRTIESALDQVADDALVIDRTEVAVSWPIASYKARDGHLAIYSALSADYCTSSDLLDVAGYGRTGNDGEVELSLNDHHCMDVGAAAGRNTLGYKNPINVVATPRTSQPVILSATARIGAGDNRPEDVFITISAWDVAGDPAGGVPFYWRCQVATEDVVG